MKKVFLIISILIFIAISYRFLEKDSTPVNKTETSLPQPMAINNDNLKAMQEAQQLEIANDLYEETDILLQEMASVVLANDFEANYDDVVKVDIEVDELILELPELQVEEE